MSDESPLLRSLRAAVAAAPEDVPLRLHFAELLLAEGHHDEAVGQAAAALQHAPGDPAARDLMARAMGLPAQPPPPATPPVPATPAAPADAPALSTPADPPAFDWAAAEQEVADLVGPRFTDGGHGDDTGTGAGAGTGLEVPLTSEGFGDPGDATAWEVDAPGAVRLADVGGMREVKERLEAAFLAPMRNPELRRLYGKSLRGGLLLYGPPGCGKTFIARAVAGELGASFLSVSLADILDMYIGTSERNVHDIFETARRQAPCVVFLDELDALGAKRSRMHHSGLRNVVNQLLTELDGVDGDRNEGVFVLAATNVPWDVDLALRRPGRLDRTLLVLPPDAPAREAILRYHLRERPIESVDLGKIAKATEDFSGADLAHVCESAAEAALLDSARTGTIRMITTRDLLQAARQIKPSSESWFASARNVAMFANDGGMYDDLLTHLKKKRKL
ncbi:tetratricopeptide repeat protein [Streptomyces sp. SKN60]|uniref:ATP-binding protein n=1 Tax=Streptomyces sp. SKN60 TaxID=2855506 RepID=UPI00224815DD|nr:AAA family ATPase [Streptomyces sp. SKN60]MCX2184174.1 tetratricopeptide repeat protein [Streptomyces sp. SKN60]